MNEIVRGMRVIKMYAWEKYFYDEIQKFRRYNLEFNYNKTFKIFHFSLEINKIGVSMFFKAISNSLSFISTRLVMPLSLMTFALMGNHLTSEALFVTTILIKSLEFFSFPMAISIGAELIESCKRIQVIANKNGFK